MAKKTDMPPLSATGRAFHTVAQLGALVRGARKQAGIPIDQAALLAGVSKQFLSDLENGKPTIQLGKAIDVAASFGIELVARRRGLSALVGQESNE